MPSSEQIFHLGTPSPDDEWRDARELEWFERCVRVTRRRSSHCFAPMSRRYATSPILAVDVLVDSSTSGAGLAALAATSLSTGDASGNGAGTHAGVGADIGQWLNGVPPVIGNVSAHYQSSSLGLLADWHYVGRRFSDISHGVKLPAYGYLNLGATYTLPTQGLQFFGNLLNTLQSIGLEEGNPRSLAGVGGNYFFARPILPRRFEAGVSYVF